MTHSEPISYSLEAALSVAQFRDLLQRSTLGERRPIEDGACLEGMLAHADILATAWQGGQVVGVARSVTDFHYCCYLSDLAVDAACQRQGIGKRLIELTRGRLGPRCKLLLIAAPAAADYYSHLGFEKNARCWQLAGDGPLR